MMKNSGVLPVGRLITPFGFSETHSKNLNAVSNPSFGKLSTTMYGILVDLPSIFDPFSKDCSTFEKNLLDLFSEFMSFVELFIKIVLDDILCKDIACLFINSINDG